MILTDGIKLERLTKQEMEAILDGLRELQFLKVQDKSNQDHFKTGEFFFNLFNKLSNFNY